MNKPEQIVKIHVSFYNNQQIEVHNLPEPVDVSLWLWEHDVQGRGASSQRLADVRRAHDERAWKFGDASRKRMFPAIVEKIFF